jgi:hypothetical protein
MMSDIHRSVFESFQKGVDRGVSMGELRAGLQEHLDSCPDCRRDMDIHQDLRAEAALRWPSTLRPQRSSEETLAAMAADVQAKRRRQLVFRPLRVAIGIALVILLVLGANWAIANVRPQPAVTPVPSEIEEVAPPPEQATPTPVSGDTELQKTPLAPFATGADLAGRGLWSPDGQWFFFDLVEAGADPLSDRRMTTANFLDPATGEVCQQEQAFLGPVNLSDQARWLPDGRLLLVSQDEGAQVLAPCRETLSLGDRFSEPVLSLPARDSEDRYALLQGKSRYWLLDTGTLSARPLEGLLPGEQDRQVWSPSGEQLAIYQPAPGDQPTGGRITLLDAESGELFRTIELPAGGEVSLLDWLLDETIYVWIFSETGTGPVLVDLAGSEPRVITVLPELFGLDLVYPDEFSADTAVAEESAGTYHIAFKVNTASDKATYLYHSESDQVEKLPVEGHTYLIFPHGDLEPLFLAEDEPTYTDEFDLIWVDEAERGIQHLSVSGHTPRDDPILWPRMVPDGSQIAFTSSQGVSLVSIPGGQLLGFWQLEGGGDPRRAVASPDSRFLVVPAQARNTDGSASRSDFYLIPIEPGE